MESKQEKEKETLKQKILVDNLSYEQIGREYGCSGANIKKVASRLDIPLPQRRKINPNETFNKGTTRVALATCQNCGKEFKVYAGSTGKFCCTECHKQFIHKEHYKDFLEHPEKYNRANYQPKAFKVDILKEQGNVCAICGMKPEWNNKELVFILDHIDGHASHNYRSNLRMICPNCDSQLDTYKSKNKNGERSYYRYRYSGIKDQVEQIRSDNA